MLYTLFAVCRHLNFNLYAVVDEMIVGPYMCYSFSSLDSSSLDSSSLDAFSHSTSFANELRSHSLSSSNSSCHDKILSSVIISLSYRKCMICAIFDFNISF